MSGNAVTANPSWRPVRSVLAVAGHELTDSVRSRRALVLLILYFLGALAATLLFVKVLHEVENQVESALGVTKSNKAGGATSTLWKNEKKGYETVKKLDGSPSMQPIAVALGVWK